MPAPHPVPLDNLFPILDSSKICPVEGLRGRPRSGAPARARTTSTRPPPLAASAVLQKCPNFGKIGKAFEGRQMGLPSKRGDFKIIDPRKRGILSVMACVMACSRQLSW
jgi:hypothetical protein